MSSTRLVLTATAGALSLVLGASVALAQEPRTGVDRLASEIVKAAPEGKQLRVAVADFPDLQGTTSDLGRYIASRLTTLLAQSRKFSVVERQRLGQVLAELKFSMTDLVDPAKAKRLGQMVGVEALLVGTVSDVGNQVDFDARMIEIETNRMVLGATVTISKDPTVKDMLERGRQGPESPRAGQAPVPESRPQEPKAAQPGTRFSHEDFVFELVSVEVRGRQVRFNLLYTNLQEAAHSASFPWEAGGAGDINQTYVIDHTGNRYGYKQAAGVIKPSTYPPKIPVNVWIAFGDFDGDISKLYLAFSWSYRFGGGSFKEAKVFFADVVAKR